MHVPQTVDLCFRSNEFYKRRVARPPAYDPLRQAVEALSDIINSKFEKVCERRVSMVFCMFFSPLNTNNPILTSGCLVIDNNLG